MPSERPPRTGATKQGRSVLSWATLAVLAIIPPAATSGSAGQAGTAGLRTAQSPAIEIRNDGDANAARAGAALYAERCADCHGADATGVRGPDLTRLWAAGASDDRVLRTIRLGVPGSIMAPSDAPDEELRAMVAYLKSLGTAPRTEAARGNADRGQQIYWSTCGGCHRVNQRGGRLGPDLSTIAGTQARDALLRAIREPGASITAGYQAVTLIARDGQQIRGVRKGEDAFSVQIMDTRERLQGYLKADLRDVIRDARSVMPEYGPDRLSDADLDDLLAFLGTLRAAS